MDGNGQEAGGIFGLARLAVEHRGGLVADFRAIYSTSLWDVRGPELFQLITDLRSDPASRFQAAVAMWDHPLSREAIYQLDTLDVLLMRWAGDKFKPVHRPWSTHRIGAKKRTQSEALRILRPHQFK